MLKVYFIQVLLTILTLARFGQVYALPLALDPFLSGEKLREAVLNTENHPLKLYIQKEIGHFVHVPLDYNDLAAGKIAIYYFTNREFDPNLPTVIYFQGGPGGGSHGNPFLSSLEKWNVVYLDYRGMGFSYPETPEILRNTRYFTSENVARDAAEVARALGLTQVSAYGGSYGTVTATIFASLFPQLVRSVVLEGVVYNGEASLWSSSHRLKILQKLFDRLDPDLQNLILRYSNMKGVNPAWFSRLAQQAMYSDHFEDSFLFMLGVTLDGDEVSIKEKLSEEFDLILTQKDLFIFSPIYFLHIACKELSGLAENATFNFVFKDQKLVPGTQPLVRTACTEMNIDPELIKTYKSTDYKISVPVFYIQGTWDGATTAPSAIWHYKNVPQNKAQLFLIKKGGHAPLLTKLQDEKLLSLLDQMLHGVQISKDKFKNDFKLQFPDWVMTLK